MFDFSIQYVTADRSGGMIFNNARERDLVAFFSLFGTEADGRIHTEAVQRATDDLKARVATFCDERKVRVPQVGAFKKLIDDLAPGEAFVIVPAKPRSTAEMNVLQMLVAWANGTLSAEKAGELQRFFTPTFDEYELVNPATDRPVTIGNAEKAKRVCRFCDGTQATGAKFKSVAHAISFGLGNVHLKLADECDTCNGSFGNDLEPHLLALLEVQRVFLGTPSRSGLPHAKLRGGQIRHDGDRIIIEMVADGVDRSDGGLTFEVESKVAVIPERCYRALAKFALSVIPQAELQHLKATIAWVRHGTRPKGGKLPPVYTNVVGLGPNPSAQLAAYIRKSEQSDLPHVVCEFRLGCFVYVFGLPFSDRDEVKPAFFGTDRFAAVFPHYTGVSGWRAIDLSSTEPLEGPTFMRLMPGDAS